MFLRSLPYCIVPVLLLAMPPARSRSDDTPPTTVPKAANSAPVADDPAAVAAFKRIGSYARCMRNENGNVFLILWSSSRRERDPSFDRLRLECLEKLKGFPELRTIRIWGGNPNGDIDYISDLAQLETLEVTNSKLNDDALALVAGLKGLKRLSLSGNLSLTDSALEYVAAIGALAELDLSSTCISGKGLRFLKGLKHLKRLNLSGTNLSDSRLADLAAIGSLEELELVCPAATFESIHELSQLTRLRKLDLYGTCISDSRLADLAAIGSLEELDLGATPVTSKSLHELSRLSRLRKLNLWGTEGTGPGAKDLRKELPALEISLPSEQTTGDNTKQTEKSPHAGPR